MRTNIIGKYTVSMMEERARSGIMLVWKCGSKEVKEVGVRKQESRDVGVPKQGSMEGDEACC
jgi:hypothetical protein